MRGPILNLHLICVLSATGSTPWERMGGRDPRLQNLEEAEGARRSRPSTRARLVLAACRLLPGTTLLTPPCFPGGPL